MNDINRAITAEDIIRRYKLNTLSQDRKNIESNTNMLQNTNVSLKNYIEAITKNMKDLQDQVDGNITTWFFDGIPNLENYPANNWLDSTEKNKHLGDLYYDKQTGYAYRFMLEDENFLWSKITDSDITKALAVANAAQDTADSKRRTFVITPIPPYDVGDIWIKNDKDLYRCRSKRSEGEFNEVDWILATDYTNDDYAKGVEAVLDQFKVTVEKDYATKVSLETTKDSIMSSVESTTTKIETKFQNQIENNATEINNNYLNLSNKLENYATVENVTEVKKAVETLQTDTKLSIDIINETIVNGVPKVKTEKGFTFDDSGFTIDANNSPTKLNADTNAIVVTDKAGNNNMELLFAGYDEELRKSIVRVANIWAKVYLNIGNNHSEGDWRMEIVDDETYGLGLGFFYMGDDTK